MSFRLQNKKYSQNDLRRLMHDKKTKTPTAASATNKKIDSPLAKYNDLGQLICILCKSIVRSEDVWKVHINAKQHKENIALAKKLKENTQNFTTAVKRPAAPSTEFVVPEKKIKGILKNTSSSAPIIVPNKVDSEKSEITEGNVLPNDFFDSNKSSRFFDATINRTSIKTELIKINFDKKLNNGGDESMEVDINSGNSNLNDTATNSMVDESLPEGFFDDPIKDAKARNLEYKDPTEEEWDRFQKEIKEAANQSNAIIAEEQEEATTDRQIDEIDEQMRNWNRVLNLERKKEAAKIDTVIIKSKHIKVNGDASSDDEENDDEFDEFLDWRAKKSHR